MRFQHGLVNLKGQLHKNVERGVSYTGLGRTKYKFYFRLAYQKKFILLSRRMHLTMKKARKIAVYLLILVGLVFGFSSIFIVSQWSAAKTFSE
jgi:hypothetical protein